MTWHGSRATPYVRIRTETGNNHIKEIGAEVRLLDGRLTADVTYYDKYTRDQIVESELSYLSNYQRVIINSGKISNKGWEISVSGVPVKVKNFEWKTIFNWSKNNSMVESLPEGIDKIQIGSGVYNVKSYAEVGKPYGAIYAKTFKRDAEGYIPLSARRVAERRTGL